MSREPTPHILPVGAPRLRTGGLILGFPKLPRVKALLKDLSSRVLSSPPQCGAVRMQNGSESEGIRFGVFQVDLRSGELWKNGARINLRTSRFSC